MALITIRAATVVPAVEARVLTTEATQIIFRHAKDMMAEMASLEMEPVAAEPERLAAMLLRASEATEELELLIV